MCFFPELKLVTNTFHSDDLQNRLGLNTGSEGMSLALTTLKLYSFPNPGRAIIVTWLTDNHVQLASEYIRSLRNTLDPKALVLHLMAFLAMETILTEGSSNVESETFPADVEDQLMRLKHENAHDNQRILAEAAISLNSFLKDHFLVNILPVYTELLMSIVVKEGDFKNGGLGMTTDTPWRRYWSFRLTQRSVTGIVTK